ncbi:MAG: glycosyltransferase family 2 protein [Myxococcota bacterium]
MVPPAPLPSLSIVLPCRNEAPSVQRVARDAVRVGRTVARRLEVLVVDDGSRDDTGELVEAVARELPEVRALRNGESRGYGGALCRGFAEARMAWVFYTDGDGQFDVAQLPALVGLLGHCDLATGFRSPRCDPPWRVLNGRAWSALTRVLLGIPVRDVNCAFKLFPRALVQPEAPSSRGALISAELLARAHRRGYRIGEAPVTHRPRLAGRPSGNHPAVIARAFVELARLLRAQGAPRAMQSGSSTPS